MSSEADERIAGLEKLRQFVVDARRTSATAIGGETGRIDSIIKCQKALRALDDAIADEKSG
jgi:hypothetical protein